MLPVPIDHVVEKLGEQSPTRMGDILWAAEERPRQTHVLSFLSQQSGVSVQHDVYCPCTRSVFTRLRVSREHTSTEKAAAPGRGKTIQRQASSSSLVGYQPKQAPSSVFSCIYLVLSDEAELSQGPQNLSNPTLDELQRPGQLATLSCLPGVTQGCSLYLQGCEVHREFRLHRHWRIGECSSDTAT